MAKVTKADLIARASAIAENANIDELVNLLEDIQDSFPDPEEDWEAKYAENDSAWRARYAARFREGTQPEKPESEPNSEKIKIDDLFKEE